MNIITSCCIPCVTEAKIRAPKGKVLGAFEANNEIHVAILHKKGAEIVDLEFHVVQEPTEMYSIDSLGEYYNSFVIHGYYYHVFKKLY